MCESLMLVGEKLVFRFSPAAQRLLVAWVAIQSHTSQLLRKSAQGVWWF